MPMSSGGRVASSSGCATKPKAREIGWTGYAGLTQHSLRIGHYVMATAEHREPCDSRGSCTVLGAPGGEIPPGDSAKRQRHVARPRTPTVGIFSLDSPGSEIGVPDPRDFAADLGALIEHLQLPDVRLVAQSMGGWTSIEYILAHPNHKVRALVLASTCGTIHRPSIPLDDPQRLTEWNQKAAAARADMARRGISPPAGERMAREQP